LFAFAGLSPGFVWFVLVELLFAVFFNVSDETTFEFLRQAVGIFPVDYP
jgi:hypothetical protein